jgi:acyl-coenzyme A thioesterase PaaI-like protein
MLFKSAHESGGWASTRKTAGTGGLVLLRRKTQTQTMRPVSSFISASSATLRRLMNIWPPFLFAGIKVQHIAPDFRSAHVCLHERQVLFNRNYFGTHFGGSLYAMTDPMYALLLTHVLGNGYNVWDQAARIEFVSQGRGVMEAKFALTEEEIARIRQETESGAKCLPEFVVNVTNSKGELVARVNKTLYVRKKRAKL